MVENFIKVKKELILTGKESLSSLELFKPVYISVNVDGYCDLLEIKKINDDTYELISYWYVDGDNTCDTLTNKEVFSDDYCLVDVIQFNETIIKNILEDNSFEFVESNDLTLENLYNYKIEENHVYDDEYRSKLSLETYKRKKLYDSGNCIYI